MTRRPPCAPACPFIVTCTHCDWQSLTPAPFIVGVSAGGAACRGGGIAGGSRRIGLSDKRSPGAVLGRSGSTGDLTDMEVSAVQNRTPYPPPVET